MRDTKGKKNYRSKRTFDLLLGSLLLIPAAPLLAFFCLYLVIAQKRSPFRWLDASGLNGVPFRRPILHFESDQASGLLKKLTRSNRTVQYLLTNLPSLLLVLKGKMSLIGPSSHHFRKHLFLSENMADYAERLQLRPGLISPSTLAPKPCSEKLSIRIEILYCEKASLSFDLWLLGRYLTRVWKG